MRDIVFYRELKVIINGLRSYGIQHCSFNDMDILRTDSDKKREFIIKVHKGFFIAQKGAIFLLKKILKEQKSLKLELKRARKNRDKEKENTINELVKKVKYQEMIVRKSMDSIAWQLFEYDLTSMRRLYYGQELIDITDSNLDSELKYIEKYIIENPEGFVLISDLTSFIQVGDVITYTPQKGLKIGELKEGNINLEIFEIIEKVVERNCPYYLSRELEKLDKKKLEQFRREVKQIDRSVKVLRTINEGEGTDIFTGLPIKIDKEEIEIETFEDIVNELLEKSNKKGHAISVVGGCLLIGAYETDKFPDMAFDVWAKTLGIEMPIIDFRQTIFDPLGYPIFLQPFKTEYILDIIQGKKVIKMTIDINVWMKTFEEEGIKWRWLSEKETARINSTMRGKNAIFCLNKRGIEITNINGMIQYIGEGIFSRIFTGLNTPSSVKKILVTIGEREDK